MTRLKSTKSKAKNSENEVELGIKGLKAKNVSTKQNNNTGNWANNCYCCIQVSL